MAGRTLVALAAALALAGWAIALASVGKLQDMCNDATRQAGGDTTVCARQLQWAWVSVIGFDSEQYGLADPWVVSNKHDRIKPALQRMTALSCLLITHRDPAAEETFFQLLMHCPWAQALLTFFPWCSQWGVWFTFLLAIPTLILAAVGALGALASALQALAAACAVVTMLNARQVHNVP